MSGSLDVIATKNPHATHDRAVLNLNNNKSVRFNDTRKFGRIYLCDDPDVVVGGLGIEPLSEKFTPLFLHSLLKKRAARIKPLLLNQNIIAGLGNIYVDEALWRAKIHPRAEARKVSMRRCELLHHAITETLSEAIGLLGTDFGDGVVHGGMYVPKVYGREGEECATCGALIRKTIVGQRGTHFCPNCQALRI
jgi:formamidopyrimidine-DNA glycosylase